jgi:hypothetical protein
MATMFTKISTVLVGTVISVSAMAQTYGTMAFSFTEVSKAASATYQSTGKHNIAIWIEDANGTFVKTRMRYAGGGTSDHLPTYSVNAGGTSGNCLNANSVGATTGTTRSSFAVRTVTWDGTNASGTQMPDGVYKVMVQETWNHGTSGTALRTFTFTKGAAIDAPTNADDANFSGITLVWTPSQAGVAENAGSLTGVSVFPNPSTDGKFNVSYEQASVVKVVDVTGATVIEVPVKNEKGSIELNMEEYTNGVYFIVVSNGTLTATNKVVIYR